MRITRRQALAVAAACGLLAAVLSLFYLRSCKARPSQPQPPKNVSVIVAKVDLPVATRLTPDMFSTVSLPEDKVPAGALTSPDQVIGKVAVTELRAGEIVTDKRVREPGKELGLSFLVPAGMRAVTVALDEVSGVAGLARPGDHVDVVATFDLPDNECVSRIVLQDVELLAVGTQLVPSEEEPQAGGVESQPKAPSQPKVAPTATLAVTPEDAQKLVLAATKGKIRLALRRAGDVSRAKVPGVTLYALTGHKPKEAAGVGVAAQQQAQQQAPPPPWYQPPLPRPAGPPSAAPSQPKKPSVEVVRGAEREVIVP
ncbi:MAG: Flp pilus assembly protein CpaB [Armatimonadetes bacterium]|nr:Flp pilus assembly protein CpaB [Armatimonadota bacterium]